jgi:hypothetical protein
LSEFLTSEIIRSTVGKDCNFITMAGFDGFKDFVQEFFIHRRNGNIWKYFNVLSEWKIEKRISKKDLFNIRKVQLRANQLHTDVDKGDGKICRNSFGASITMPLKIVKFKPSSNIFDYLIFI